MLASLNHPNIAQIHGIEESDDTRALVLELVEGPTLAAARDLVDRSVGKATERIHVAAQIVVHQPW